MNSTAARLFTFSLTGRGRREIRSERHRMTSSPVPLCFTCKQKPPAAFLHNGAPSPSRPVTYKHMKAKGLVRLQPHLEEEIAAVPVGDVRGGAVRQVSQVNIKVQLLLK